MRIERHPVECDACTCLDRNGYIIQLSDFRELFLCEDCANKLFETVKEATNEERPV